MSWEAWIRSDKLVVHLTKPLWIVSQANSGKIRTTVLCGVNSITCPADLIYTSDSACTTTLLWEIENYSASTGLIVAWVKVSSGVTSKPSPHEMPRPASAERKA